MKAKKYASDFINELIKNSMYLEPTPKSVNQQITSLAISLFSEINDIRKNKKDTSDKTMKAIILQQNDKWNYVCEKVNNNFPGIGLIKNGFLKFADGRLGTDYHGGTN